MTFRPGKKTRIWINGFRLTRISDTYELKRSADAIDTTVHENDDKTYMAGLRGSDGTFGGIFDGSSWHASEKFAASLASTLPDIWSVCPDGDALGNLSWMYRSIGTQLVVSSPANGRVGITGGFTVTAHVRDAKVHIPGTVALTSTGALSSIDNAAPSLTGGRAHFHLTDRLPGVTGVTAKIQHSSAGTVWADLITFTTTSTGAQSSTVAGTVKRFTRGIVTALTVSSGSKQINCLAAFARSS